MMAKPTRTAIGRGLDAPKLSVAKQKTAEELKKRRLDLKNYPPKSTLAIQGGEVAFNTNVFRRQLEDKLKEQASSLDKKVTRNQMSGARMGRAMAAAKAKQKSK